MRSPELNLDPETLLQATVRAQDTGVDLMTSYQAIQNEQSRAQYSPHRAGQGGLIAEWAGGVRDRFQNPMGALDELNRMLSGFAPTEGQVNALMAGEPYTTTPEDRDRAMGSAADFMGGGLLGVTRRAGTRGAAVDPSTQAQRGILTADIRGRTQDEAMQSAGRGRHLIRDPQGQYVGAPRGIDSPQKLAAMRRRFDQLVERGQFGGDWYDRAKAGIDEVTGGDPRLRDLYSDEAALWSSQATPDTNSQFMYQAHNAYEAGRPLDQVRTGQQAETYNRARDTGTRAHLGPKTHVYMGNLNPNESGGFLGTNDIWHARSFGYTNAGGEEFSRGLSPQEHVFLDHETLLAAQRANAKKLGGRDNWTAAEIQAAPWVYKKGMSLHERYPKSMPTPEAGFAEANKTYPEHFDKYNMYGTHEAIPAAGGGHLTGIVNAPEAERMAYSLDPRSSWVDEQGHDLLYDIAGMYNRPSLPATGAFTSEATGQLETNAATVARPLISHTKTMTDTNRYGKKGRRIVTPTDMKMVEAVESVRAYLDGQAAGAAHKPFLKPRVMDVNGAWSPGQGALSTKQVRDLDDIAGRHNAFAVDRGDGITLMVDPGAGISGAEFKKNLTAGPLSKELKAAGYDQFEPASVDAIYKDYEGALSQPSSGQATAKMLTSLNRNPKTFDRMDADPRLRQKALDRLERDAEVAAASGRPELESLQNARKIVSESGFRGLREALLKGAILPAAVLATLSPLLDLPEEEPGALSTL